MFVIVLTYIRPLTEVDNFGKEHLAFLDKFFSQGTFIVSGRRNPRTGGVIIANGVTREQIEDIVKEDPFYQNQLAEYTITEFTPVKYQKAFEQFVKE